MNAWIEALLTAVVLIGWAWVSAAAADAVAQPIDAAISAPVVATQASAASPCAPRTTTAPRPEPVRGALPASCFIH
jgi:hypothetical protein